MSRNSFIVGAAMTALTAISTPASGQESSDIVIDPKAAWSKDTVYVVKISPEQLKKTCKEYDGKYEIDGQDICEFSTNKGKTWKSAALLGGLLGLGLVGTGVGSIMLRTRKKKPETLPEITSAQEEGPTEDEKTPQNISDSVRTEVTELIIPEVVLSLELESQTAELVEPQAPEISQEVILKKLLTYLEKLPQDLETQQRLVYTYIHSELQRRPSLQGEIPYLENDFFGASLAFARNSKRPSLARFIENIRTLENSLPGYIQDIATSGDKEHDFAYLRGVLEMFKEFYKQANNLSVLLENGAKADLLYSKTGPLSQPPISQEIISDVTNEGGRSVQSQSSTPKSREIPAFLLRQSE